MLYGAKQSGKLQPLTTGTLGMTVAGQKFQVEIATEGITNEEAVIAQMVQLEAEVPDLKVLSVETNPQTGNIIVEFMDAGPGQFALMTVVSLIPQLLILVGVTAVVVAIYGILPALATVPMWTWYAIGIGGAAILLAWLTKGWEPSGLTTSVLQAKKEQKDEERKAKKAKEEALKIEADAQKKEQQFIDSRNRVEELIDDHSELLKKVQKCNMEFDDLNKRPPSAKGKSESVYKAEKKKWSDDLERKKDECIGVKQDAEQMLKKIEIAQSEMKNRLQAASTIVDPVVKAKIENMQADSLRKTQLAITGMNKYA